MSGSSFDVSKVVGLFCSTANVVKRNFNNKFVLQCKTNYLYCVTDKKENKATTITFRTSEELKKKLENMAAKQHRTLSNLVELLLEKAVETKR